MKEKGNPKPGTTRVTDFTKREDTRGLKIGDTESHSKRRRLGRGVILRLNLHTGVVGPTTFVPCIIHESFRNVRLRVPKRNIVSLYPEIKIYTETRCPGLPQCPTMVTPTPTIGLREYEYLLSYRCPSPSTPWVFRRGESVLPSRVRRVIKKTSASRLRSTLWHVS